MTRTIIKTDKAPAAIGPYSQANRPAASCSRPGRFPSIR